jgi:hypothetical protein
MENIIITPAYGRDYKSAKSALVDFDANKDFIVKSFSSPWDGKPVNKEQLSGYVVQIRFDKLRKVKTIDLRD